MTMTKLLSAGHFHKKTTSIYVNPQTMMLYVYDGISEDLTSYSTYEAAKKAFIDNYLDCIDKIGPDGKVIDLEAEAKKVEIILDGRWRALK